MTKQADNDPKPKTPDGPPRRRLTQRERVIASLIRCPDPAMKGRLG